jgi:GcrA cell cycle regulator
MTWDAAKTEMLRQLHATKKPFSWIADAINDRFGTHFTRNAAIGKAARMQLDARAPAGNEANHVKREGPRVRHHTPRKQTFEPSQVPSAFTVTILQLEPWMCRYVEGDGPFYFCAAPKTDDSSYCIEHKGVCHVGYGRFSGMRSDTAPETRIYPSPAASSGYGGAGHK